jgi:magnesium-transporting ATPase (P-type)
MEGLIAIIIIFYLILIGGLITVAVLYLKNLQDTLKEVSEHNRQVPPGNVWLMFIPLFNIIYPFILYPKISDSLRAEFEERGKPQNGDYGRSLGITMPILGLCGIIPLLGVLAGIGNLVVWIIFWVKMAEFKNMLRSMPKSDGFKMTDATDILD